jgi:hypothetical protein
VSALARRNGWRGFDNAGAVERVDGGWEYVCDGMPHPLGCGGRITVSRRWKTVGTKKDGWLVCYGLDGPSNVPFSEHTEPDLDVVLTFCPSCAAVVREQEAKP